MPAEKKRRKRSSFFQRLVCMALLCFALPSILLCVFLQLRMQDTYREYSASLAQDSVTRIAEQLDYRMSLYEMLLEGVARNDELNALLGSRYADMLSKWKTVRFMESSFGYVFNELPGIQEFRVYHDNPTLVEDGGILWKPGGRMLGDETDADWYARTIAVSGIRWRVGRGESDGAFATLSTRVGASRTSVEGAVYLRVSMARAFGGVLASTKYSGSAYAVTDGDCRVILATGNELAGAEIADTQFAALEEARGGGAELALERDNAVYVYRSLANGWRLYGLVPATEVGAGANRLMMLQLIGVLCLLGFCSVAIVMVVRQFTARLQRLERSMREMSHGELNVSLPVQDSLDELGIVEARFNRMARRIKDLMNEVETQKIREMEETIRAMESYVNPHFLYNTLGLIRWRALDDGDESLCELVDDMTSYYRLSLSGGRSVVLVEDELSHLQAYIAIQQRRYGDSVNVVMDVDDQALVAYTPKNILQTIVENSYLHGLIPGKEHNELRVSVKTDGARIRFTVEDNGMGMPPERLAALESDDERINPGIGIRSVRQRLRLYFGQDMTMRVQSEPGRGTSVFIEIPYCETEPTILRGA